MRMTDSAFSFLLAEGFYLIVVLVLHFVFGMGVTTAWLTFLGFTILSCLAATAQQIDEDLERIKRELGAAAEAIARIETQLRATASGK